MVKAGTIKMKAVCSVVKQVLDFTGIAAMIDLDKE